MRLQQEAERARLFRMCWLWLPHQRFSRRPSARVADPPIDELQEPAPDQEPTPPTALNFHDPFKAQRLFCGCRASCHDPTLRGGGRRTYSRQALAGRGHHGVELPYRSLLQSRRRTVAPRWRNADEIRHSYIRLLAVIRTAEHLSITLEMSN